MQQETDMELAKMHYFRVMNPLPLVYHLEDIRGVFSTLIVGSKSAILIDTAMGIGNIAKEVRSITNLPLIVVNTHGHVDHTLGNYQFPKVYLAREDWELAKEQGTIGVKKHVLSLSDIIPYDFDKEVYFNYRYDNLVPLKNDDVFDLGGISIVVVSLPSHTHGSMGFLCPELGLLLSGDSIAPLVCLVFPESSNIEAYIEMLEKVKKLCFSKVLSSHSKRLIPKEEIDLYIKCARNVDPELTTKFKSTLFPDYPGKMFFYENPIKIGEYAVLVYSENKYL